MDGEVPAGDGYVQHGRLGIDEAEVLGGYVLGEEEKGFCGRRSTSAARPNGVAAVTFVRVVERRAEPRHEVVHGGSGRFWRWQ